MKFSSSVWAALSAAIFATNIFADNLGEVSIEPAAVHVPSGFDSNDKNVQILVTGFVRDSCIQGARGDVKVDNNKISIIMKATNTMNDDTACTQVLVPYLAPIELGPLPEGIYDIIVNERSSSEIRSVLVVDKPSAPSTDNFIYANVQSVEKDPEESMLILKGAHPSSCMNLERIELVANENGNTFSILPIVKREAQFCSLAINPFEYKIPVPSASDDETIVFHIRTIAGKALNFRW